MMRAAFARMIRDAAGVSAVEFALSLPLLALLGMGGLEYINFVLANQKIERISAITADTISRNTLAPSERSFIDAFASVDKAGKPFNISRNGRTILTGVIGVNQNGKVVNKIVWQRCGGQLTSVVSSIGTEWTGSDDFGEGPDVTLPDNIVLQQNQMAVVSEVAYRYEPLIDISNLHGGVPDGIIRQRSIFVTRGQAIPNVTPIEGLEPARC